MENKTLTPEKEPDKGAVQPSVAETAPVAVPAAQPEIPPIVMPKNDQKGARFFFNAFNFAGLHLIGNSALSLWITYNIQPKPATQKFLHGLANAMTPAVNAWDFVKRSVGLKGLSGLSKEVRAERITQSARSFTEVAVMCIAGSIILLPVKYWEDHKKEIVDKVDGWLHPDKKRERDALMAEAKRTGAEIIEPPARPDHKETWWNLIRARALALIPIFWIDSTIQNFNNNRASVNKPNVDTYLWEKSAAVYDNMHHKTREGFIKFFSSKGVSKEGIQPLVLKQLEKTVGSNTERMIFAEQGRLFSKEIYLTTIYTAFLFVLGKTRLLPSILETIGFKSKEDQIEIEHALDFDKGLDAFGVDAPFNGNGHEKNEQAKPYLFSSRVKAKEAMPAPELLHTQKIDAGQSASVPSIA